MLTHPLLYLTVLSALLVSAWSAPESLPARQGKLVVDGSLDDPAWEQALALGPFLAHQSDQAPAAGTTAWVCYDEAALYLAFRCADPRTDDLVAEADVADAEAFSSDDSVEVFLTPGSKRHYYQFRVNTQNVHYDRRNTRVPKRRDQDWNGDWRSAVQVIPGEGYQVEIAIPWFNFAEDVGTSGWALLVSRFKSNPKQFSSYPGCDRSFHDAVCHLDIAKPEVDFATFTGLSMYNIRVPSYEVTADGFAGDLRGTLLSQQARTVRVAAERTVGSSVKMSRVVELAAGVPAPFRVRLPLSGLDGDDRFVLRVADVTSGAPIYASGFGSAVFPHVYSASLDRNYYTTELEAQAVFALNVSKLERPLIAEVLPPAASGLQPTRQEITQPGTNRVSLPLAGLSPGRYPVQLRLSDQAGKVIGETTWPLVIKPAAPEGVTVTKIDHARNCLLVDGTPFFPRGAYGIPANQLKTAAEAGFNLTMRWRGRQTRETYDPSRPASEQQEVVYEYLDAVREAGMYAFAAPVKLSEYYFKFKDPDFEERYPDFHRKSLPGLIELASQHPATIAYYNYDEPLQPEYEGVREFAELVWKLDPYHLNFTLFAVAVPDWREAFDFAGKDYYPDLDSPMVKVFEEAQGNAKRLEAWRVPYVHVPLLETSSGRPEPLSGEMQLAQVYLALIGGAKGLFWWVWPATYHDNWVAIKQALDEVKELEPALLANTPPQVVTYRDTSTMDSLKVLAKVHDGQVWLLTANASGRGIQANLQLPETIQGGEVLFGQQASVVGARITADYAGYERRVYRLDGEWPLGGEINLDLRFTSGERDFPEPLPPISPDAEELVRNGGFERDFEHVPDWPEGWYPSDSIMEPGFIGAEEHRWGTVTDEVYEGERSMRLVKKHGPRAGTTEMLYYAEAPALSGHLPKLNAGDYLLSLYLKAKPGDTGLTMLIGWGIRKELTAGSEWKRHEIPFSVAAGQSPFIRLYLVDPGTVWIDNVSVQRQGKGQSKGQAAAPAEPPAKVVHTAAPAANTNGNPKVEPKTNTGGTELWRRAVDGAWSNPGNWSGTVIPDERNAVSLSGDYLEGPPPAETPFTLSLSEDRQIEGLYVTGEVDATLDLGGNTLELVSIKAQVGGGTAASRLSIENGAFISRGARNTWVQKSGTTTVGSGASLQLDGGARIAGNAIDDAMATLAVRDGGSLTMADSSFSWFGQGADQYGRLLVSGNGSTVTTGRFFYVGSGRGIGDVLVDAGGKLVTGKNPKIGEGNGAGTVTIRGAGSSWESEQIVIAGDKDGSSGTIQIEDSASVSIGGSLQLGPRPGSAGTVAVTGRGTRLAINDRLCIGGDPVKAGGSGTFILDDGASVTTGRAGHVLVWPGSTLLLRGGDLTIGDNRELEVHPEGALEIHGGLITAANIVLHTGSKLVVVLNDSGFQEAPLAVANDFRPDPARDKVGATLEVRLAPGFTPQKGQVFQLAVYGTDVEGMFKGLANGARLEAGGKAFRLSYGSQDQPMITLIAD